MGGLVGLCDYRVSSLALAKSLTSKFGLSKPLVIKLIVEVIVVTNLNSAYPYSPWVGSKIAPP